MASEFKVINTQAEFDEAIKARLERERSSIEKRYADYDALKTKAAQADGAQQREGDYLKRISEAEAKYKELESKYKDAADRLGKHEAQVGELTKRAEKAEQSLLKARIAHEYKIPHELAERLAGGTEEELKKDAEGLAKYLQPETPVPLSTRDPEPSSAGTGASAYRSLLSGLMGQAET